MTVETTPSGSSSEVTNSYAYWSWEGGAIWGWRKKRKRDFPRIPL